MTTLERLRGWNLAGVIDNGQYATLADLVRKDRFSVYRELSAALYVGVLALVTGLGWTIRTYFKNLGDLLVLITLSVLFVACFYYGLRRADRYSRERVESPNLALDYVLYLGCLALSVLLGYLAFRFDWFRPYSDDGVLFIAGVFAVLAYRFDNRFVLSLALASVAGWFGLKLPTFAFTSPHVVRLGALAYGAVVAASGAVMYRQGIKRHFLEAYLHVAANAVFAALVSGAGHGSLWQVYLLVLLALSSAAIALGARFHRFAFV